MDLNRWVAIVCLRLVIAVPVGAVPVIAESALAREPAPLPPAATVEIDYSRQIRPLLEARCLECHGPDAQESHFRVDRRQSLLEGGDIGEPAVLVGNSGQSHLVRIVAGEDPALVMPPEGDPLNGPLNPAEIGLLRAWIDQGLKMPEAEPMAAVGSDHWSLQPLEKPPVPELVPFAAVEPAANPIDAFVRARLADADLKPSPPADSAALIRRVYLDMLGLLPSPAEVEAFVHDPRPEAYPRLVDRVLATPLYGERWARHWLDVVRFAESNGFETNHERPTAYHYRDYVVRALNEDKPFDRFVFEQLAGDAVGADAATGFLVGGAHDVVLSPDPGLTAMQRQDELADIINTTGTALLGLTIGCARCHNHKFDPVTQEDYYAMQAVFAGVRHGERPLSTPQTEQNQRQAVRMQEQLAELNPQLDRLVSAPAERRATESLETPPPRVLLIDDAQVLAPDAPPLANDAAPIGMIALVEPRGQGQNPAGTERGQKQDAGAPGRLPNVSGGRYTWWTPSPGQDVAAYVPAVEGEWRVWLSWGCGWETHAPDAVYLIDQDGDPATTEDQQQIAQVDQQRFADGSGDPVGQPLWSGFYDAGVHAFQTQSRILLRGGTSGTAITADVIALEEATDEEATDLERGTDLRHPEGAGAVVGQPRLRAAVSAKENVETFAPRIARFVRMTISATNTGSEPCLDELEVWSTAREEHPPRNVALASAGARVRSSGDYQGSPKHQLEHIHDGRYGNDRSWISSEGGRGWIELELAEPVRIDRITWGRDREQQYKDRLPVAYQVEVAREAGEWQTIASSEDRLPAGVEVDLLGLQLAFVAPEHAARARSLAAQRTELQRRIEELSAPRMAYAGRFEAPGPTHRLYRGDPTSPREQVAPDTVAVLGSLELPLNAPEPERRIALADSIIDPANPLTARVIANRLWHYHFGRGLVATPSDFGAMGAPPSHPELLDWLAAELRDGALNAGPREDRRWSLKHLHRLILLSATYRQSCRPTAEGIATDADSRLLWRYPPRRLEAEAIRDNILLVSGSLDGRMEGPGFLAFHPNSNYARNWIAKDEFGPPEFRRMLYATKLRMERDAVFGAFDCPDGGQVAPQRTESTTPIQSLNLFNSNFVIGQAGRFAERVRQEVGDDSPRQVARVFQLALGRSPGIEELAEAVALVDQHGLPALCRAIYNSNAFLFLR